MPPIRCCESCGRDTRSRSGYCPRCLPRRVPADDPADADVADIDPDDLAAAAGDLAPYDEV